MYGVSRMAHARRTGFSREDIIPDERYPADVPPSSRLKPLLPMYGVSRMAHARRTGFSREDVIPDERYPADVPPSSRLKPLLSMYGISRMAHARRTGFSREDVIPDERYPANGPPSSRLKPHLPAKGTVLTIDPHRLQHRHRCLAMLVSSYKNKRYPFHHSGAAVTDRVRSFV